MQTRRRLKKKNLDLEILDNTPKTFRDRIKLILKDKAEDPPPVPTFEIPDDEEPIEYEQPKQIF